MSDGLPRVLARLEAVVAVTPLSHRGQSPAFRLELGSGALRKARVFATASEARRVEVLLRAPGARDLPRPAFRDGRVLVTEFIEGVSVDRVLAASPGSEQALAWAAGELLGRLHRAKAPAGARLRVGFFRAALLRVLRLLVTRGLIEADEARALAGLPVRSPGRLALTHGDLCPENLVLDRQRRLRAIDEERLAVRPIGFDLARAISRWPLDASLEARLLAGYERAGGDPHAFRDERPFWLAAALSTSVGYRLRVAPQAIGPALARLRRLASEALSESAREAGRKPRAGAP